MTTTHDAEKPDPGMGQAENEAELNRLPCATNNDLSQCSENRNDTKSSIILILLFYITALFTYCYTLHLIYRLECYIYIYKYFYGINRSFAHFRF